MTPTTAAQPTTYGLDASVAQFSAARYDRMVEAGILTPDDQVELLENWVVLKMPRNPPHDSTIQRMNRTMLLTLPPGWDLRVQLAVALPDSRPEPDFAVVRGSADDYESRHPVPADVALVVEVAYSSLLRDQRDKARIYARAGVPVYWIVNLVDRCIEVYSMPSGPSPSPAYATLDVHGSGGAVPLVLDGTAVASVPCAQLMR